MDIKPGRERNLEEIERDIEATRHNLSRTLDALHDKLSIGQRMRGAVEHAQDTGRHFLASAGRWIKNHPSTVVLVALPLLLLVTKTARARRS
jgi:hypothetical protein